MTDSKRGQGEKLKLPQVTLVAMTSVNIVETVKAMKYSMKGIDFGAAVFISHRRPWCLPKEIAFSKTDRLRDIDCFNYKMVYELAEHIPTEYAMIVHADGYIVHPEMWQDSFLAYDYIGSPWPYREDVISYRDSRGQICRVGNSVSIRSKRLMEYPKKAGIKWEVMEDGFFNEDTFLCCKHKNEMEDAGMRWAPVDVAKYFAHEHPIPEVLGITPFAFHKWWGANAAYPVFKNPWKELWRGVKNTIRPFLFWRWFRK